MAKKTIKRNLERAWDKYIKPTIAYLISGFVGYLLGFYLDGCTNLKHNVNAINNNIKGIADSLSLYRNEANISIDYIKYNSSNGTTCKIGINNKLQDHFVAVSKEKSHGLKQGEKIYLINVNESEFSIYTKIAFVQIMKDSPKSNADFFVNKTMLKRLNIDRGKESQGIFTIYYKQDK